MEDGNSIGQHSNQLHTCHDNFSTEINSLPIPPLRSSGSLAQSFKNGDSDFGRYGVGRIGAPFEEETIVSLINQKIRDRSAKLINVAAGITRRMVQLDVVTGGIEDSIDELKDSAKFYHDRTHVKLKEMENLIREIQGGILDLRDKREIAEAQLRLAELHFLEVNTGLQSTNKSPHQVAVEPALSSPPQEQQPIVFPQQSPYFTSYVSPNPPPENILHSPASTTTDLSYLWERNQNLAVDHSPLFTPVSFSNPGYQRYDKPTSQTLAIPVDTGQNVVLNQQFACTAQPSSQDKYLVSQHRACSSNQSPHSPEAHHLSITSKPCVPSGYVHNQPAYNRPLNNLFMQFSPEHVRPPMDPGSGNSFIGSAFRSVNSGSELLQFLHSSSVPSDESSYSSLPTAKELPRALPMALKIDSSTRTGGNESNLETDDMVDILVAMGFRRDRVRATVRKLSENGGSVDSNTVLDELMSGSMQ